MGDRDLGEARYRAFLSYSHKDAVPAGRLHRRLESWRIPRRLVGRETAAGRVPARLWPIFRDREELPAATDLSQTVREALAQSGALIVLCSPHAAASLWVAEEIRVFRELHPGRPILAAILEGDPPDCFPPLLRALGDGHEPLATDLRRDRDGERLGLLKLVAGITGLGLDDLVQRDASRRVRRVMAVTVGAVLIALSMGALALLAITARHETERQRVEAEDLVKFMQSDLRERLRSVGRLDIMREVNRRALAHFERQRANGEMPADVLLGRARTLQAIGEDEIAQDPASAEPHFREAHALTSAILASDADDPERIYAHAQSEYWVGRVYELREDWPATRRQYGLYAAAVARLIAIAPGNPDYMLEMGWGVLNRGIVLLRGDRNPAAAHAAFGEAIGWFERAIRVRPRNADVRDLANAYTYLAETFYMRQLWRESLAPTMQAQRLYERAQQADPDNAELAYRLAIAERTVARLEYRLGHQGPVPRFLTKAWQRMTALTARDPRNSEWALFRAKIECDLLDQTGERDRSMSNQMLRESLRTIVAALGAQRNPRISDISICVDQHLNRAE